jgi:hypothetical protein
MIWIALFIPETRCFPLKEIETVFGNEQDAVVITSVEPGVHYGPGGDKATAEHVEG